MNAPQLITRCAHCRTVFRISTAQLQAHGGQVRCGRCLQVFDGLAGLQAEAPQPAAAQPDTVAAVETAAEVVTVPRPAATDDVLVTAAEDRRPVIESPDAALPSEDVPGPEKAWIEMRQAPEAAVVDSGDASAEKVATAAVAEPLIDADNPFVPRPPVIEPHRRAWAAASALLFVVIAGQVIYFYRGEVAARHALAREWITAACAAAGCTVEMPQRPKSVLIEGSDLQVIDPARPEQIQLTATLRNHAGHAVGFPALDLVLTNTNDHTLARRVFVPAEYLPATVDRGAGLAANAEMTVRLALDAGSLGASGFRLAVLPAAP